MLESRAAYGYYGVGHGASGETSPKTHASGWRIMTFVFATKGCGDYDLEIRACDYAHALKNAKRYAKRDGYIIVGDAKGWETQRNW